MLSMPIRAISRRLQESLVTPTELCVACTTRADYIKDLQAFVRLTRATGDNQANESWSRYKIGKAKGILDGIPIAVKDNFCTRNIPTTCGSKMLENFVPTYNATAVQKLEDAGTVLIGKCNMDEFAMGSGTVDSIFGPTRNVWGSEISYNVANSHRKFYHAGDRADPIRRELVGADGRHYGNYVDDDEDDDWNIAGGSSGGSAVAVAAGAVFASLGSDTGGSTRNPAAYCGVIGLKPTYGLVSRHGLIPLVNSMDAPSVLARSVDDAAIVLDCIAGPDKLDSTTVHREHRPIDLSTEVDLRKITVGIPREYHCPGMAAEVVRTWTLVADMLEKGGATVKQVSMPHTQDSIVCYSILNQVEVASNMARYDGIEFGLRAEESSSTEQLYAASRAAGFNDVVRSRILAGNYFLLQRNYDKYFVKALKVRRLIADDFDTVWAGGIDVLLTPTTLTDAPRHSAFVATDNRTQCAAQDFCTQPANMAGCPAISVPITLSERGLPLSLQLMSKNFEEQKLLSVAQWIEKKVDFPRLEIAT